MESIQMSMESKASMTFATEGESNRRNRVKPGFSILESEILRKPVDTREDPRYEGQTEVFLLHVPTHSNDNRREVDIQALREWIMYGIIEEDPFAQRYFDEIQKISKIIEEVETKLLNIPKIQFLDQDGQPMRDDRAREQREKLFDQYGQERIEAETRLEDIEKALKVHLIWRKTMKIEFNCCEVDSNTNTATWRCKLSGTDDVDLIEDLLLQKMNWAGIKLTAGEPNLQPPVLPWAGRGSLPDGKIRQIDYYSLQVNMLGVRIVRAPHGVGFRRTLDRTSTSLSADNFSFYYGEYELGLKHGYGIDVNDAGVYQGGFEKGFRHGKGRLDLADGTTIIGDFSITRVSSLPSCPEFDNPYLEGEPTGQVEIHFGDGGYYRGHMVRGIIQGPGDYQSAFNEILSGNFKKGMLHGENCIQSNPAGEVFMGHFSEGGLQGKGSYQAPSGACYEGDWDHHMKHGRGILHIPSLSTYRGYYIYDIKHGKASFEYNEHKTEEEIAREKARKERQAQANAAATATAGGGQQKSKQQQSDPNNKPSSTIPSSSNNNSSEETARNQQQSTEDDDDQQQFHFSEHDFAYLGYLHGSRPANRGCYLNCKDHLSHIISRSSRRAMNPINYALKQEERQKKQYDHKVEKSKFFENYLRDEISRKKIKVFKQQKHLTKKMIYEDDVLGRLSEKNLFESKHRLREARLTRHLPKQSLQKGQESSTSGGIQLDKFGQASPPKHPFAKKAQLPRLRLLNTALNSSLTAAYDRLKPDSQGLRHMDKINDEVVKIALSDFEEVRERQRFLKFDSLWQRAEIAFEKSKEV
eukprot:gene638-691_t